MIKVIFENYCFQKTLVAEVESKKDANAAINKTLQERGIRAPYWRLWTENNQIVLDFGSHSEFFYIEGITIEEWFAKEEDKVAPAESQPVQNEQSEEKQ